MKTASFKFSYGLVKNASLEVPSEACSIHDITCLIFKSYLAWRFGPENRAIMSDEVVVSSLGKSHFFAGALGGYEGRLDAETFALLKQSADNDIMLACDVVRFRAEKQGRTMSRAEVMVEASKNEALDESSRKALAEMAKLYS